MKKEKNKSENKSKRKKNVKRSSGVCITDRDIDIFKVLSSGATELLVIHNILKKVYKKELGIKILRNRLCRLRTADYLQSQLYMNRLTQKCFALYALNPSSIAILIDAGFDIGWIRAYLPGRRFVDHDIKVTEAIRAVKKEATNMGFDYSFRDELTLRKSSDTKKNTSIPDLQVKITIDVGSDTITNICNIEIDNGTMMVDYVVKKILRSEYSTVILCKTLHRINTLRGGLLILRDKQENKDNKKNKNILSVNDLIEKDRVLFAIVDDFIKHGLSETNFITIEGKSYSIFGDYKGKLVKRLKECLL